MKIPMFNTQRAYQAHKPEFDRAVLSAMEKGDYVFGSETAQFEANLAKYMGVKHVIGVGSGTDALQIALMSLNLPLGSSVLLPSYNYVAAQEACLLLGFKPVYCDVLRSTGNVDISMSGRILTSNRNIRAVIVSHLFGKSMELPKEMLEWCKDNKVYIIEDVAQSLGAVYRNGKKAGTAGDIGITSFYPTKNLACFGDGGAIFTNNKKLAQGIRMIANHGQRKLYQHEILGVNSRLDNIQAAILNVKLKYLEDDINKRRTMASFYEHELCTIEEITLPLDEMGTRTHTYNQFVILLSSPRKRDSLRKFLLKHGIDSRVFYPYSFGEGVQFKNSIGRYLSWYSLALPVTFEKKEISFVCDTIKKFFKK